MAAYASLVSLMHIIEQIKNHPRPPVSFDEEQVESLTKNIAFLQGFLEAYNCHGGLELEDRIADAAHAAEDIIESHIVDRILPQLTGYDGGKISSVDLYQGLQRVIQDMDIVKKDMMEMKDISGIQHQLPGTSTDAVSLESRSSDQNNMVGFDDILLETLDKLIGKQSGRQIIPIVGMGGIGKTTLARNVYQTRIVIEYFYIRVWLTISQEFSVREILLEILCQNNEGSRKVLSQMSEVELRVKLHKSLFGRRYLIIMDDIWSIEALNKVKFLFPNKDSESRVVITTRLSKRALNLYDTLGVEMKFLDADKSWELLCKTVFEEGCCPSELEEIGKRIVENCKGLPLSIVVIGGLLAKAKQTLEYWEYIAENLNSVVNLDNDERCLKLLQASYDQLPVHLKPCFLYMGVFPEDHEIRITPLIKLWVAEGFLKPINGKSLEETAEKYLMDLVDRNLILVSKWRSLSGKISSCTIHDLLRDLCLREAQKENFLCVTREHSLDISRGMNTERRIAIHPSTSKGYRHEVVHSAESVSLLRSLICYFKKGTLSLDFRLLRVLKKVYDYEHGHIDIFRLVNARYIAFGHYWSIKDLSVTSPLHLLWNLQTLIFWNISPAFAPYDIWKMPHLRHVQIERLSLPDPPQMDERNDFVLENLQTLMDVKNFKCSEEVVKRIPSVTKLRIFYTEKKEGSHYCLNDYSLKNLCHLHKLESLRCSFHTSQEPSWGDMRQNLHFPHSLKKLTLYGCLLHWEDMSTKIGSLPLLQVLRLETNAFVGPEWETVEGQFCSLRILQIWGSCGLEYWKTESTHFPHLERIDFRHLGKLKEIPSDIGEIPTFRSIQLKYCSESAMISAKEILDQQEEFGNECLQVRVEFWGENRKLESLESCNFQVKRWPEN